MPKGAYVLFIDLRKNTPINVGRLGSFTFKRGQYLYVGSALNNLEKRIARHRSKTKKLHWHIDYLLQFASIAKVLTVETNRKIECLLNTIVSEVFPVEAVVKGFGSSDCRCQTHLWKVTPQRVRTDGEIVAETGEVIGNVNIAVEYPCAAVLAARLFDSV
jgi:Uri superfamily endonuclease